MMLSQRGRLAQTRARSRVASLVVAAMVVATGCADDDVDPLADVSVVDVDFVGVLESVERSEWTITENGGPRRTNATPGGPFTGVRVGPGTLQLADGTIVDVADDTPGPLYCDLLGHSQLAGQSCIVIGAFKPGTTTAEWFAIEFGETLDGIDDIVSMTVVDGLAYLGAGMDAVFAMPFDERVGSFGCPPGVVSVGEPVQDGFYYGAIGPDDQVTDIWCVGID